MNGQLAEADAAYQGIYAKAKNSIFIIDDYIGIKSIMHLRNVNSGVMITVFSDNGGLCTLNPIFPILSQKNSPHTGRIKYCHNYVSTNAGFFIRISTSCL